MVGGFFYTFQASEEVLHVFVTRKIFLIVG